MSLARVRGQQEAIENIRTKRLEKESNGFCLNASEGTFSCRVCSTSVSGKNAWWDLNGIKCLDCQRNIRAGIIPAEICKHDEIWIKDWQLHSHYGVRPSTARKLRKQGLLQGRDLKKSYGVIYFTVYLINENQAFLENHPKIESKIKITYTRKDGKSIKL